MSDFQLLECESPPSTHLATLHPLLPHYKGPILRLFGCTPTGESVLAYITHMWPYLYFPVSPTFGEKEDVDEDEDEDDLGRFEGLCKKHTSGLKVEIVGCEVVRGKEPLTYYRVDDINENSELKTETNNGEGRDGKYSHFVKIMVAEAAQVGKLAKMLGGADELEGFVDMFGEGKLYDTTVSLL
ncbi:hypothetical protein HK102_009807 [Quaeritorhiza haematococci]|nr:hypothetical protein HK102_009807 [Quaeritorhiza haematococci]